MIKSPVRRMTSAINLIPQSLYRSLVDIVATRGVVHIEESISKQDVIDRVAAFVQQNVAIETRIQLDVGVLLNGRSVLSIVSSIVGELHAGEQGRDVVCVHRADAVSDLVVGLPGQVATLVAERAWEYLRDWGE
jgi:hypothetical protein